LAQIATSSLLASLPKREPPLNEGELERLRLYLPATHVEALGFDPAAPPETLLRESGAHLMALFVKLAAHLPTYLRERIMHHPSAETIGGRFVEGALLFSDVSGFTAMSEKLSQIGREGAEEITVIINRYFTRMQGILRAFGGQLIQFGGDALLGLFPNPHGAERAIEAGLAMQVAMGEFRQIKTSQGEFPLQMKVGLHGGQFFDAQLGASQRMSYGLFGADVNATAAAESAAGAGQVLISRATLKGLTLPADYTLTPIGEAHFHITSHNPPARPDITNLPMTQAIAAEPTLSGLRTALARLEALAPYLPAGLLARVTGGGQSQEGEHRLVSMMFVNVQGLGDIADRLGPGQETRIVNALNRYFVAMEDALRHYGGVLNKIDLYDHGDKLMAFFGAPVAHEDDAERAVHAALAMQAALPEVNAALPEITGLPHAQLTQQIGISYGYVFAGYVGAHWRREYTVMGDAVNLAARLMSVAQAQQVIVSPSVRNRAEGLFDLEPRGEVKLKGKTAPVPIYLITGTRTEPQSPRMWRGVRSPLVGRRPERQLVLDVMERLREGRGQIVTLMGEAGQGKSRLIDDIKAELLLQPEGAAFWPQRWVEGRCLSYTETVSYWPLQEVARQLLGLKTDLPPEEARAQAREVLAQRLTFEQTTLTLPYLLNFLNLPLEEAQLEKVRYLDAEGLHRRTLLALTNLIESSARAPHGPLVIVLEDIHWIDQASRVLLEQLMPLVNRVPLLWALLFRPERTKTCWQIREKALRELAHCTTEINLAPLTASECRELLVNLTQVIEWPADFAERLLERTEGNPLYLEELVRTLINENALQQDAQGHWHVHHLESVTVPDTLQGMLMARLDLLDEPPRRTAQVASVVGRLFSYDVLSYIQADPQPATMMHLGENLAQLQQHEIIYESQRAPTLTYSFKHGMMQEVYYASLLARVSRQYHCQIAEYLETHTDAEHNAALIAHHAFQGQSWERALHYQLQAGQQAKHLFANQEAIEHLTRALHCAESLPFDQTISARQTAQLALGELLTTLGKYDPAREHLTTARELAQQRQEPTAEALACYWLARGSELQGEYPPALDWIRQGQAALAEAATSEQAQLQILAGFIHSRQGDKGNALKNGEAALQLAAQLGEVTTLARAHVLRGHILWQRGSSREAIENFQRSLDLYQQAGDLAGQATAYNMIGNAYFDLSELPAATQAYRQAREVFSQLGDIYNRVITDNNLGEIALNQGRLSEALIFYQEALSALEQIGGSLYIMGILHNNLGATHIYLNQLPDGLQHLRQSMQLFEQAQSRDFLPELRRHWAEAALAAKDYAQAQIEIEASIRLARELDMRSQEGISLRVWGEILRSQNQTAPAEQHLSHSITILSELGDQFQCARSRLGLAGVCMAQNRRPEAQALLAECLPVFEHLEAALDLAAARQLQSQLALAPVS
jgi:class 3 adenylate cyclase/predicted ATPase